MAERISYLRIKYPDGTMSGAVPISVRGDNVYLENGYNLSTALGEVDVKQDGSISAQIKELKDELDSAVQIFDEILVGSTGGKGTATLASEVYMANGQTLQATIDDVDIVKEGTVDAQLESLQEAREDTINRLSELEKQMKDLNDGLNKLIQIL